MRRKKDNKTVLRRGNGRENKRNRRTPNFSLKNRNNNRYAPAAHNNYNKQKKRSRKTVLLMILILFAFIVGAGIGVLMSFDDGTEDAKNETHYENVTVEMTTHLNESKGVVFDESDRVDFNENKTSQILGAENNPYYNYTGPE